MVKQIRRWAIAIFVLLVTGCSINQDAPKTQEIKSMTAAEILGNPNYRAISFGAYREKTRDIVPTVSQLKDDLKILAAMDIKVLRTYNTKLKQASNLLQAIRELKQEQAGFEMYVMLGAWIDSENAWTESPNPEKGDFEANSAEIARAVAMTKEYSDIVKVIAVGNEAMVHWATSYFVVPRVILHWVNHLQDLKKSGELPADLWITSSDNFASWGGGEDTYHNEDLVKLIKAVDFISVHTYPFHDTHYNSAFWQVPDEEQGLTDIEKIDNAMLRAKQYAMKQYQSVVDYIKSLGVDKPIHIGETGWSTTSSENYGAGGSQAADEYKAKLFHKYIREWTDEAGISCFYFEAFDEQWKDFRNPTGSENHFGLINLKGQAKYPLWELVDKGVFDGLTRDGVPITKTFNGDKDAMMKQVLVPPSANH